MRTGSTHLLLLAAVAASVAAVAAGPAGTGHAAPARAAGPPPARATAADPASQTVRFTVRPVILLVVDASGAPLQLWTNIAGDPTAAQVAALRVRRGSVRGPEIAVSDTLRAAAGPALDGARWGRQGLLWARG